MPYSIDFDTGAVADLKQFPKGDQVRILKAIEVHLTHQPMFQSKSRIKRLRAGTQPPYRLRVDEFRVYYDVDVETLTVAIFGIVHKDRSLEWLAAFGRREEGEK